LSRSAISIASVIGFIILLFVVNDLAHRDADEPADSDQPATPPATGPSPQSRPRSLNRSTNHPISPEGFPLKYSIGQVDPRFGVPEGDFLQCARDAARIWESAAQRQLFQYDPSAPFRLNLVFDERQAHRNEQRSLRSRIDSRGNSFDLLKKRYDEELRVKAQQQQEFERDVRAYDSRLDAYNTRANQWNSRGGAPPEEISRLRTEQHELEQIQSSLQREQQTLNNTVTDINSLADAINGIVQRNNIDISSYNGEFKQSREFEKGVFDGRAINIYELDGEADLRLALVHEFGHALGFDHVNDPDAVMYYKLERQDTTTIRLTMADVQLVQKLSGRIQ
jgi:hypothetical protein